MFIFVLFVSGVTIILQKGDCSGLGKTATKQAQNWLLLDYEKTFSYFDHYICLLYCRFGAGKQGFAVFL